MRYKWVISILILLLASCQGQDQLDKASSLYNEGKYSEAVEIYNEYLRTKPEELQVLYNRGRALEEMNKPEKAVEDFEKILDINEYHVSANLSMGMDSYFRKKDYAESVKYLNNALEGDKTNAKALTLRGKAYQRLGDQEKALSSFNTAIRVKEDFADAYYARGGFYLSDRQKSKACSDFQKAQNLGLEAASEAIEKYCK